MAGDDEDFAGVDGVGGAVVEVEAEGASVMKVICSLWWEWRGTTQPLRERRGRTWIVAGRRICGRGAG